MREIFNFLTAAAFAAIVSTLAAGCETQEPAAYLGETPSVPDSPAPPVDPTCVECGGSPDIGESADSDNSSVAPRYQIVSAIGNAPPELPKIYGRN